MWRFLHEISSTVIPTTITTTSTHLERKNVHEGREPISFGMPRITDEPSSTDRKMWELGVTF